MAVKKRCGFCRKHVRPDGTCSNPDCPRYVTEIVEEPQEETPVEDPKQEEPAEE